MSRIGTTDFLIEVAKGNIDGHSLVSGIASGSITTTLRDVWGGPGDLVYPTAAETWGIVSDDTNDTSAGTGARLVLVTTLDDDYLSQVELIALNGTTEVALTNSNFRPVSMQVVTSGSVGWNVGTITAQVASGGDARSVIAPTQGLSSDGHFTVPAGKDAYILQNFQMLSKNISGEFSVRFRASTNPDPVWLSTGVFPVYQNQLNFEVLAKFPIPERFDYRVQVKLDSGAAEVKGITEFLLVDME